MKAQFSQRDMQKCQLCPHFMILHIKSHLKIHISSWIQFLAIQNQHLQNVMQYIPNNSSDLAQITLLKLLYIHFFTFVFHFFFSNFYLGELLERIVASPSWSATNRESNAPTEETSFGEFQPPSLTVDEKPQGIGNNHKEKQQRTDIQRQRIFNDDLSYNTFPPTSTGLTNIVQSRLK